VTSFSRASAMTEVFPHESISVVSSQRSGNQPLATIAPVLAGASSIRSKSESNKSIGTRQEIALQSAMSRHMSQLETRASEAVQARKRWEDQLNCGKMMENLEHEKRKNLHVENAKFLVYQMKENEGKRRGDKQVRISDSSAHAFPPFSVPSSVKKHGEKIRNELDLQVQTQKAFRNLAAMQDRELVIRMNDLNKRELEKLSIGDQAKRVQERNVLQESWKRDIELKNCWKAIENFDNHVGVLLPPMTDDDDGSKSSVVLGASSSRRRAFTGSLIRK